MRDKEYIYDLYKEIYKLDFFNESLPVEDFNWDSFFYEAAVLNTTSKLIESFEPLESKTYKGGHTDTYKIKTEKGKEFILILDYWNKTKLDIFIYQSTQAGLQKNSAPTVEYFEKLKDIVGQGGELCFISFKDEQGRHTSTGDLGLSAFEVFTSLKLAVLDSFVKNSTINLKGIVMLIDKKEQERRLTLYKKLLTKNLPQYNNIFVDEISDKEYTHLIATI